MRRLLCVLGFTSLLVASGCGQCLTQPEALPRANYPAGTEFTMSLIMTRCSDPCVNYEAPNCNVSVDAENRTVRADASICYSQKEGIDTTLCSLECGPQVLSHCVVPALEAGDWTVQAGTLTTAINVR